MRNYRNINWRTKTCLVLAIFICGLPAPLQAAQASSASRWLSKETIPELQTLLAEHPRYEGQRIQIVSSSQNDLSAAIATVVNGHLSGRDGISLVASSPLASLYKAVPGSVDELNCQAGPRVDYLVQISVRQLPAGRAEVRIDLLDVNEDGVTPHSWQWQGAFSGAERHRFNSSSGPVVADGSLNYPWSDRDVDVAAMALSRDFACALRPQIKSRLGLKWVEEGSLPGVFADTANTSRHLLGSYRELGLAAADPNYTVEVRVERFRNDIWQLWLTGTPSRNDLASVQAVTYFRVSDPEWLAPVSVMAGKAAPRPEPPPNLGDALEFIDVEMLDATQADSGHSRAELQVTLRIANRAEWPIEFAFTLSGGHFNHCIARPDYYRHDRYGHLAGNVEAGTTVVRRLLIENAQHQPAPWFGVSKCAGFKDLDAFEEFASQGYKVTDFVRWDM